MNPEACLLSERAHVPSSPSVLCLFSCRKRQQPISPRFFGWFTSVFNADYTKIKDTNGLDCYLFVRFLRMMVRMMLPIWLLSWAVLLPVTSVHSTNPNNNGLDIFVFGNVNDNRQNRYAAHVILAWIFTSKVHRWHPCGGDS